MLLFFCWRWIWILIMCISFIVIWCFHTYQKIYFNACSYFSQHLSHLPLSLHKHREVLNSTLLLTHAVRSVVIKQWKWHYATLLTVAQELGSGSRWDRVKVFLSFLFSILSIFSMKSTWSTIMWQTSLFRVVIMFLVMRFVSSDAATNDCFVIKCENSI